MSLFVEVNNVEKGCPVIINLDHIVEIAPLASGGCALFMTDGAGMNSKTAMRVSDSYELFKQFAMETVSADDIRRRFPKAEQKQSEKGAFVEKLLFALLIKSCLSLSFIVLSISNSSPCDGVSPYLLI
mgnify:CR=1 FL=1